MRNPSDPVAAHEAHDTAQAADDAPRARVGAWLHARVATPWDYDYFAVLRRLEALAAPAPRWGHALLPGAEPLRVGQEPSLSFAPSSLSRFEPGAAQAPRLRQLFFGYIGPNGPLPLHLTEYAHLRQHNAADETLVRFADIFHHRMASLFFRAWAESEPTVSHDRPQQDRFALQLGALAGLGMEALQGRDAMPDLAKVHFTGRLASHTRNAEGLGAILASFFAAPVEIREFVPKWVQLPRDALCLLGRDPGTGTLGSTATAGARIRVYHHRFRIVIGPLELAQYERLLPGAPGLDKMAQTVRNYLGDELDWEVNLVLHRDEVPAVRLGRSGRLGWTGWMGKRRSRRHADDLTTTPPLPGPTEAASPETASWSP